MGVRANVMWDEQVWKALSQVPRGERSSLVNQAVSETLLRRRREQAQQQMRALRKAAPKLKVNIVEELRRDRARGA